MDIKELFGWYLKSDPHPTQDRWKAFVKDMIAKGKFRPKGSGMLTKDTPLDEEMLYTD
jgi:hypothetical protein